MPRPRLLTVRNGQLYDPLAVIATAQKHWEERETAAPAKRKTFSAIFVRTLFLKRCTVRCAPAHWHSFPSRRKNSSDSEHCSRAAHRYVCYVGDSLSWLWPRSWGTPGTATISISVWIKHSNTTIKIVKNTDSYILSNTHIQTQTHTNTHNHTRTHTCTHTMRHWYTYILYFSGTHIIYIFYIFHSITRDHSDLIKQSNTHQTISPMKLRLSSLKNLLQVWGRQPQRNEPTVTMAWNPTEPWHMVSTGNPRFNLTLSQRQVKYVNANEYT